MPEDLSVERAQTMKAFGTELILTPKSGGINMRPAESRWSRRQGRGITSSPTPATRASTTRPRAPIWEQTEGRHALRERHGHHGHDRRVALLREKNPGVRIIGAQLPRGLAHPGHPQVARGAQIYDPQDGGRAGAHQDDAEDIVWRLAREEGIFGGISAAGACWVAQRIAERAERDDRLRGLRPGRSLPVHRRLPA